MVDIEKTMAPRAARPANYHWRAGRDRHQFRAEDFHFGLDFDKYDITAIGDLFGLSHREITDLLVAQVAALDKDVGAWTISVAAAQAPMPIHGAVQDLSQFMANN